MRSGLPVATGWIAIFLLTGGAPREDSHATWEADNPIQPIPASPLGIDNIADYERTRLSGNSPWDRWTAGETNALSDEA